MTFWVISGIKAVKQYVLYCSPEM